MTVEEKVYSILSGNAGVTALCPATRIKPSGDVRGLDFPFIVYFPVSVHTTQIHNTGLANLKHWLFQISCFGETYSSTKALAVAVVAALGSYRTGGINSHYSGERTIPYEPFQPFDTKIRVEQIALEFDIWDSL